MSITTVAEARTVIEAMRELSEQATSGRWDWSIGPRKLHGGVKLHYGLWSEHGGDVVLQGKTENERLAAADAALIVAAVNAWPAIIEHAEDVLDRHWCAAPPYEQGKEHPCADVASVFTLLDSFAHLVKDGNDG